MTQRPLIRRRQAREDIEGAVTYYLSEAGDVVAARFITAVERALHHIAMFPASGSPRYAQWIPHAGLRSWPVKRFPYLVFYLDNGEQIDVWRVLHAERDIPSWLVFEE